MTEAIAALSIVVILVGFVIRFVIVGNPLNVRTCEFCRFYDQSACRRYPPARVYTGDVRENKEALDVTVWPVVKPDNWCGDHQRKS